MGGLYIVVFDGCACVWVGGCVGERASGWQSKRRGLEAAVNQRSLVACDLHVTRM